MTDANHNITPKNLLPDDADSAFGKRPEFKDGDFSRFHLSLGRGLYSTDLDCLEYRAGRGNVAMLEVKRVFDKGKIATEGRMGMGRGQSLALHELARKADLPFFIITYTGPVECLPPLRKECGDEWVELIAQDNQLVYMPELWEFYIQVAHGLGLAQEASLSYCNRWIDAEAYKAFTASL